MLGASIFRLEELTNEVEQLSNLATALCDAMFEGPNSADNYGEAMFLFSSLMHKHRKSMKAYFDEEFAERRKTLTLVTTKGNDAA